MTDEKPSLLLNWAFAELSMNAKQNTVRTKQKLKKKESRTTLYEVGLTLFTVGFFGIVILQTKNSK